MADFTKEIGHEATCVGWQDKGEDRAGGAVGQAGERDLQLRFGAGTIDSIESRIDPDL